MSGHLNNVCSIIMFTLVIKKLNIILILFNDNVESARYYLWIVLVHRFSSWNVTCLFGKGIEIVILFGITQINDILINNLLRFISRSY